MYSLRKWIFRPKRSDQSLLAGFFYADEELNMVATELDSFDGRKDPERCTALVNQLRLCQDKVLNYIEKIMDDCITLERASRDFRVKFPDDVLQESLSGQLWFGAECLAAGSSIMNREVESASMRPLAKTLTRHLDYLRSLLRDQCLRNINAYTDRIKEALITFDRLFAEFELSYVSAMVPVKTMKEYDVMQEVIVLFSETTQRALRLDLLNQDMVDDCDPALMFTIPRLAIVAGLLVYPEGPLNPDMDPVNMSEMFRPFQTLLYKIRELLWTLSKEELWMLEKSLCSPEDQSLISSQSLISYPDDFDPYENLIIDPSDSTMDGAIGPPGLDIDDVLGLSSTDAGRMLGVDQGDYVSMSQSPSTMTLVAAQAQDSPSDQDIDNSSNDSTSLQMPKRKMKHQDSTDSGMLSENGSLLNSGNTIPMAFESGSSESRSLRHSLSWPEPTRRHRRRRRGSVVDFLNVNLEETPHTSNTHQSSHDFRFHLPLTSTDGEMGESRPWDQTPTNAVDLGSTRVFFTSDCYDSSIPGPHSTQQISYVTDTLNEVFVTDTSFQTSFISAVTSKALSESLGICCKCGNKTCAVKESGGGRDSTTLDDIKQGQLVDHLNEFNMSQRDLTATSSSNSQQRTGQSSHSYREPSSTRPTPSSTSSPHTPDSPQSEVEKDRLEATEKEPSPCKPREIRGSCSSTSDNSNTGDDLNGHQSACDCQLSICDLTPSGPPASTSDQGVDANHPSHTHQSSGLTSPEDMDRLAVPQVQRVRYTDSMDMMCSACNAKGRSRSPSVASADVDWDRESYNSSETSSYNSECHDDEEIALAIQAAELASRREARSRFKSSNDLIHRLFVCISGVADQLQTNYASDLRHILKDVFECNSSEPFISLEVTPAQSDSSSAQSDPLPDDVTESGVDDTHSGSPQAHAEDPGAEDPPKWVPDEESPHCESCEALFTFVRRRHHCRNCGKIFCGRCSSNAVPLPHYGHTKPVRVCNRCFMFQVNPFTVDE